MRTKLWTENLKDKDKEVVDTLVRQTTIVAKQSVAGQGEPNPHAIPRMDEAEERVKKLIAGLRKKNRKLRKKNRKLRESK